MQQEIKIIPISAELYPAYYNMVQQTVWGNPMLPANYSNKLWGYVVFADDVIIGGWVGTLRGDIPIARIITKSVYFDSYPIFFSEKYEREYQTILIDAIKQHADQDNVVMLNLTHWVRGEKLPLDINELGASFITNLHTSEDDLWAKVESKQRNCIRKGEKSGVKIYSFQKEKALAYLKDFQNLRQRTQQHAIKNNAQASMLLKSDDFFINLIKNNRTILANVIHNNKCVAAVTFIIGGKTAYAHMSGSDSEANKTTGAGTYYYWKAIEHFMDLGYDQFDFGGCPCNPVQEDSAYGIFMFKQGFGGDYQEFSCGKIIIASLRYKLLQFLLSQRKLLRLLSKNL